MKFISCHAQSHQIFFLVLVLIFAGGLFSPQPVEARMDFVIAMPATEGDPTDGLDYCGGGSGEGLTPPEEIYIPPVPGRSFYSLNSVQLNLGNGSVGLFLFTPSFNGKSLFWTLNVIPMPGGSN